MTLWKIQRGEARYIIYEEQANGHCETVAEIPTVKRGRKLKMNEAALNQIIRDHNRAEAFEAMRVALKAQASWKMRDGSPCACPAGNEEDEPKDKMPTVHSTGCQMLRAALALTEKGEQT